MPVYLSMSQWTWNLAKANSKLSEALIKFPWPVSEENSRQLLAEEARQKEEQRRKQEEREEAKRNKRKHKQQKKKEKNKQKDEATEASKAEPSKGDANEAEGSKAGLTSAGKITNGQDAEHPASPQPTKEQIPAAKSATIPPPEVQPIASKQPADKVRTLKP